MTRFGLSCALPWLAALVACGDGIPRENRLAPDPGAPSAALPDGLPDGESQEGDIPVAAAASTDVVDAPANVDEVELALASGDASVVAGASRLEQALIDAIDEGVLLHADTLASIFELGADGAPASDGRSLTSIRWNPTHDAAVLAASLGENTPLLFTDGVFADGHDVQEEALAVIGEADARYLVMGGNPMRNHRRDPTSLDEQMHRVLENGLAWLTDRDDLHDAPFDVVLAQLEQSYHFPDELGVRAWLDERFPGQVTYNERDACDGAALDGCLASGPDLLIVSAHQLAEGGEVAIAASVARAMDRGVPVLYLHLDGHERPLSKALFSLFDVSHAGDNYWRKLQLVAHDPTTKIGMPDADTAAVRTLVENLRDGDFTIDWDACVGENCDGNDSLNAAFADGLDHARGLLRALDADRIDLFDVADRYRYRKLLALLADHYRGAVRFPMDRKTTPTPEFLRALVADHLTYQYRDVVGTWSDLGNFGRTDFSHVTPTRRTVKHVSRRDFRSTGAYALPGQSVTVTRRDDSAVQVGVRVNTLRDGSTHVYAENGYTRPRGLQTQSIRIEPGETLRFTSAIGGPIQLEYDANDLPVEVVFDGVGEHAYWRDTSDDASFAEKLYAAEFDWAEIAAPSFEVHSTREKMVESLADPMFGEGGGTPRALVDATMRYVHDFPHVLAGFQGPGVSVVEEIHGFADDHGLPVANLDLVKHMNADQASCGYGCSGNPYDAYWSFSPIGHGDIHELGHGLERARFLFSGWPGHAVTNFYSYYTKSRYFEDTGEDPSCQSLPFEANFEVLRASVSEPDPGAHVRENLWTDPSWSRGAAMIIQMMMAAEGAGALVDGWHLLARLHLVEREYRRASRDDDAWLAARGGLGMNQYARAEARSMSPEDWLVIAVSHATGFDHRAYFDVWGHAYTNEAGAQVAAMALPSMPLDYYVSSGDGFCRGEGFDGRRIALDGIARWPAD